MKRYRARRARHQEAAELNVTAFMNLMVVLVPFLLILAVFSRITVHELNLPGSGVADDDPPQLQLEVVVRADRVVISDRRQGVLQEIENQDSGYDIERLAEALVSIKTQAPEVDRATILLEPEIDYQSLITVMDTVRGTAPHGSEEQLYEALFPRVSIGDAPAGDGGPET
ncbi:hypothetical protein CAI21_02865 [Alkalilimnicola ehrlichii]|uniref:Biopolymer transporter ExbD n=1 Tax=Alkalilimnicola ehrlichii TaxID=351052 RepID=A0A3E0X333_9GAMM|nr:biopolymer transporter ExbD [Alkalilimnicola ehrlichii]RFA30935.1 hypothetical protein CAI21_02865 [Alkalilimnicola ehrlichii]RFA38885.1 hypothetical protein CAL65_03000 [Alkalilimnicola ehrlichii]